MIKATYRLIPGVLLAVLLAGCGGDMSDLGGQGAQVTADRAGATTQAVRGFSVSSG